MSISQMTPMEAELERLSDAEKLSAHVTRIMGQNPGVMTLQGTNSYLLQPPSNPLAPMILIDTSSPHTAQQYIDVLFTHLFHLGLESGIRETHFESAYAKHGLKNLPEDKQEEVKAQMVGERVEQPRVDEEGMWEYGPNATWVPPPAGGKVVSRKLPTIEHIILTHRHLDHVGALPLLLKMLQKHGCGLPKIWKLQNPDEDKLLLDERERPTSDGNLVQGLPNGTFTPFLPFQPIHTIMPGMMISIIDPVYRHLLAGDKKWNDVPEIARVSLKCLRTPGHTADSISLVLCEGEKGVFTGDTILGQGTTVISDLAAYMTSLKTLLALKPNVLYPAHGPHTRNAQDSKALIEQYISHRQSGEDQIILLLKSIKADPTKLGKDMAAVLILHKTDAVALNKYQHEFLSGKPYVTPAEKAERVEKEEKEKFAKDGPVEDRFKDATVITIPLMARLIYQTDKESVLWAAGKSLKAHLNKLVGEGKVVKVVVRLPKIVDGVWEDDCEQDGYEWAEDMGGETTGGEETQEE